ncbi:hypothetical protein [Deinococcus aerophilus]|nr:hypothetical protein [Deinococcus aerophilus]
MTTYIRHVPALSLGFSAHLHNENCHAGLCVLRKLPAFLVKEAV